MEDLIRAPTVKGVLTDLDVIGIRQRSSYRWALRFCRMFVVALAAPHITLLFVGERAVMLVAPFALPVAFLSFVGMNILFKTAGVPVRVSRTFGTRGGEPELGRALRRDLFRLL